jgi:hypothetical protein
MSDPRDRDFPWTEHSVRTTITETVAPNISPVWRWRLWSDAKIVDQRGVWRWLRPLVQLPSLYDLIVEHAAKAETMAQIIEGNALMSKLVKQEKSTINH